MPLLPQTKSFLNFLQKNQAIRLRIKAQPNNTLLYAGNFIRPMWQELELLKRTNPNTATKQILPDVLANIQTLGQPYVTLLEWVKALDCLVPWKENGFVVWKALSGIFASNAVGSVSFAIGSEVNKLEKVFAATELPVLLRNTKIDGVTKDVLAYYQRCIANGNEAINFGVIR